VSQVSDGSSLRQRLARGAVVVALLLLPLGVLSPAPSAARAADQDLKPLDRFFRGRITALDPKTRTVTIRYDFSKEEQLKDWPEGMPFPVERVQGQVVKWFDEMLEIQGSTGVRHIGAWKGDLLVKATIVPDAEKDMGGILHPADGAEDIATFTLLESYFHGWDGKSGGQNSIIKFGKQWREAGSTKDYIGFRYVAQRPPVTPLVVGRPVSLVFGLDKGRLVMTSGEAELKGKDLGKRLKETKPGFYTVAARMLVDDVEITGELAPDWLKEQGLGLTTETPIETALAGVDPETRAAVEAYAKGGVPPTALLAVVKDGNRSDESRQAAADALAAGTKSSVPHVLDLLYDADLATRTRGIQVVKALLGKDYGYNPKASEAARSAAIRKINDDLKEHPELLQD
jgi:hypothetical protein